MSTSGWMYTETKYSKGKSAWFTRLSIRIPAHSLSKSKSTTMMSVSVTIGFGTQNHVVAPDLAIVKQSGAGDRYIYVYKDGKVSYEKVELGRRMGNKYEVISGVNSGDQVVVSGQSRLNNGMEVEIEK